MQLLPIAVSGQQGCGWNCYRSHPARVLIDHYDPNRPRILPSLDELVERGSLLQQLLVGGGFQLQTERLPGNTCMKALIVSLNQKDIQVIDPTVGLLLQRQVLGRNVELESGPG